MNTYFVQMILYSRDRNTRVDKCISTHSWCVTWWIRGYVFLWHHRMNEIKESCHIKNSVDTYFIRIFICVLWGQSFDGTPRLVLVWKKSYPLYIHISVFERIDCLSSLETTGRLFRRILHKFIDFIYFLIFQEAAF